MSDHQNVEKNTRANAGTEDALEAVIVEEMEYDEPIDTAYSVDNYNYQVFSGTTAAIPPVKNLKNQTFSVKRPGLTMRQLTYKLRSIDWNSTKQQLFSKHKSPMHLILIFLISILFMVILGLLFVDRRDLAHERWLRTHQCQSYRCLNAAGLFHEKRNKSVSPCENFYQYACGQQFRPHHPTIQPDTPNAQGSQAYQSSFNRGGVMHLNKEKAGKLLRVHRPAIDHLTQINIHAIIAGLDHIFSTQYTEPRSAKYKVAQWYKSCTFRTIRNMLGTRAFFKTAATTLGGIWLLDRNATNGTGSTGDINSTENWPSQLFGSDEVTKSISMIKDWSWMDSVKKLQVKLHVPVFVDFEVWADPESKPRVYFSPDWNAWMTGSYYTTNYEKYITSLYQQLGVEAGIPFGDAEFIKRIKRAIKDVELVGRHIYNIVYGASSRNRESVSIGQLSERGSAFDWKGLLTDYFSEVGIRFNDKSRVYSRYVKYLQRVPTLVSELQKNYSTPVFNRIMNNYMLWNTMDAYAWHMSYDMGTIQSQRYSHVDSDLEIDCFILTHEMFGTVLSAIFVEHHLHDEAANHTKTMLGYIKSSAHDQIEQTKWMDSETKRKLEKRIDDLQIKYTVPDIMTDDRKLDYAYRRLKNSYLYVENLLSAIAYMRTTYNRLFAGISDPDESDWLNDDVNAYDAKIGIQLVNDQLYVPLGAVQPPVYHHTYPAALNFAGFGSLVGTAIAHLLGELGSYKMKENLDLIWSEMSWQEYLKHWLCIRNRIGNSTKAHFNTSDWLISYVSDELDTAASLIIDDATGLQITHRAFDKWMNTRGDSVEHTVLPGEYIDRHQLFYISYAQTFCEKITEMEKFIDLFDGDRRVPFEVIVNHILSESPEFAKLFKCPVGSRMNPTNRCSAPL